MEANERKTKLYKTEEAKKKKQNLQIINKHVLHWAALSLCIFHSVSSVSLSLSLSAFQIKSKQLKRKIIKMEIILGENEWRCEY